MWRRFLLLINAALSWVVVLHGCRKGMLLCPATSFFFRLIYWSAHGLLPVICAIWKDGYIVLYRSVASGDEIARKHWAPDIELHTHRKRTEETFCCRPHIGNKSKAQSYIPLTRAHCLVCRWRRVVSLTEDTNYLSQGNADAPGVSDIVIVLWATFVSGPRLL